MWLSDQLNKAEAHAPWPGPLPGGSRPYKPSTRLTLGHYQPALTLAELSAIMALKESGSEREQRFPHDRRRVHRLGHDQPEGGVTVRGGQDHRHVAERSAQRGRAGGRSITLHDAIAEPRVSCRACCRRDCPST